MAVLYTVIAVEGDYALLRSDEGTRLRCEFPFYDKVN